MIQNVVVVCRYNQARSVIAESVLKQKYPGLHISSAGIEAITGNMIPNSVTLFANSISLKIHGKFSRNIDDAKFDLRNSQVVIIAEEKFRSIVSAYVSANCIILSLDSPRIPEWLIPIDPIRTDKSKVRLELELAKTIAVTLLLMNGIRQLPIRPISIIISKNNANAQASQELFIKNLESNQGVGLNLAFRSKFTQQSEKIKQDTIDFSEEIFSLGGSLESHILHLGSEPMSPYEFYLSASWSEYLNKLKNNRLVLLTESILAENTLILDAFFCLSPLRIENLRGAIVL